MTIINLHQVNILKYGCRLVCPAVKFSARVPLIVQRAIQLRGPLTAFIINGLLSIRRDIHAYEFVMLTRYTSIGIEKRGSLCGECVVVNAALKVTPAAVPRRVTKYISPVALQLLDF
jgi:hypothetical protein